MNRWCNMCLYQPSRITFRLKTWRWFLLVGAVIFLTNCLAIGFTLNDCVSGNRPPAQAGPPLGPVLAVSSFLSPLLNGVGIKKSINDFRLVHLIDDEREAYERYLSINPMYSPGILKPSHHQQAFLQLDLPPPR